MEKFSYTHGEAAPDVPEARTTKESEKRTPEKSEQIEKDLQFISKEFRTDIEEKESEKLGSKKMTAFLLATLGWAMLETAHTPHKSFEKSPHKTGFETEIGIEKPRRLHIVDPDHFTPKATGTSNDLWIETLDEKTEKFANFTTLNSSVSGPKDIERFNKCMEIYFHDPVLRAKAGMKSKEDCENPTPEEAMRWSQAIVEKLNYSQKVADDIANIHQLEKMGVPKAELSQLAGETIGRDLEDVDQKPPEEIYGKHLDIVCRHAAKLFETNMHWLQSHHGKKLQTTFATSFAGHSSADPKSVLRHIWNRVVTIDKEEITMTFIDVTPETKKDKIEKAKSLQKLRNASYNKWDWELKEGIQTIGSLREREIITEKEYRKAYEEIVQVCETKINESLPKTGKHSKDEFHKSQDYLGLRRDIAEDFMRSSSKESDKEFFTEEQNKYATKE
jgi:hypothetical protein